MRGIIDLGWIVLLITLFVQISSFPPFAEYVQYFGKNYDTEQYARRQLIYNAKLIELIKITEYVPAVNQFTDQTIQEIEKTRVLRSEENPQSTPRPLQISNLRVRLPTSKDWRDYGVVTSIKNQGSCGSCWTFAGAAYSQSKLIVESIASKDIDFSEQYLLQCTEGSTCDGGFMQNVFKSILNGLPMESQYPYRPFQPYSSICEVGQRFNIGQEVQKYYKQTDQQIIEMLEDSPLAITISANQWENYGSGVFSCNKDVKSNHAVLLIGYTEDYWIVKNQWGVNWGEKGFMRINRDQTKNCKIGEGVFKIKGDSARAKQSLKTNLSAHFINGSAVLIALLLLLI